MKIDIDLKKINDEYNNPEQNNPQIFISDYLNLHKNEIKNLDKVEGLLDNSSSIVGVCSRKHVRDRSDLFRVKGEVLGALEALNYYLKEDQIKYNNELISKYRKIIDDEITEYHNYIDINFESISKDNDLHLYSNKDINPDNTYISIENKLDESGDLYINIEGDSGFKGGVFLNKLQIQQIINHLNGVLNAK